MSIFLLEEAREEEEGQLIYRNYNCTKEIKVSLFPTNSNKEGSLCDFPFATADNKENLNKGSTLKEKCLRSKFFSLRAVPH